MAIVIRMGPYHKGFIKELLPLGRAKFNRLGNSRSRSKHFTDVGFSFRDCSVSCSNGLAHNGDFKGYGESLSGVPGSMNSVHGFDYHFIAFIDRWWLPSEPFP
jgi:hypothetical protein